MMLWIGSVQTDDMLLLVVSKRKPRVVKLGAEEASLMANSKTGPTKRSGSGKSAARPSPARKRSG
jgi:hypothetical protein